jgi:Skp family chaperone for outer membrane proteins
MIETPLSIYLVIPSSIFILIVGFVLWFINKTKQNLLFLFLSLSQFLWSFGAFIVWKGWSIGKVTDDIFINKIFALAVFLIPVFIYHFTVEFCKIKNQKIYLFLSYLISLFFVFVVDVKTVINGVFFYKWGDMSTISIVHYLFSLFVLALLAMSLYNLFNGWRNKSVKEFRKDTALYLLLGISIFGLVFIDFLPIYGVNIYPLFYLTIPIYALIIAYVLIEKNPLASMITTDILVAVILTLLSSLLIFPELEVGFATKSVIFILISVMSFLVLKYTHQLNEQKDEFEEKIKERTGELEDKSHKLGDAKKELESMNDILEAKVAARTRELQELNNSLERQVAERTRELKRKTEQLEEKIKELEQFSDIFVNREEKMVELKDKIRTLEEQIK